MRDHGELSGSAKPAADMWDAEDAWADDSPLGRDVARVERLTIGAVVATPEDTARAYTWRCPELPRAERAVNHYLRELQGSQAVPGTLRSYAYALQRWLRFLAAVGVEFDGVSRSDYYDYRSFLTHHGKSGGARRARRDGFEQRNRKTGKVHAHDTQFGLATIQHSRSVLHEWYEFLYEAAGKPLINPIPHSHRRERGSERLHAHHNPMDEFQHKRTRLRDGGKRGPKTAPRHMSDDDFEEVWNALTCHRDRALLFTQVDSAVRPSEILGLLGQHVDWGTPSITVVRKGTRAVETVPISPEAALWIRRYQQESNYFAGHSEPLWINRRGERSVFTYNAYRAMLHRVNGRLGTDWTPHDLRHTGAVRMLGAGINERLVQEVLGHADISTLSKYTRPRLDEIVQAQQVARARPKVRAEPSGYDSADLATLFGSDA